METPFQDPYAFNGSQDTNFTGAEGNGSDDTVSEDDLEGVIAIWRTIPPFLIVLGTFGNVLIIAVLIRSAVQRHTTGMFLCALAVSDLFGLYFGLVPKWIEYLSGINVHERGNFLCKVLPWITYSVTDYSAWLLVIVTIERVVATCFPPFSKSIFTRRFAVGYLVSCGFTLLCINGHMLFGFEYTEEDDPEIGFIFYCDETPVSYRHFYKQVWPWIDITVYCLLPFTIICVGNCVIVLKVKSSYRRSVRNRSLPLGSMQHSLARRTGKKRISNLTVTLLLINSGFFVSTVPVCVFVLVEMFSEEYFEDEQNFAKIEIWWVFVYNFMFLNNTFNVLLYCLSGSKFRRGLLALFRKLGRFSLRTSSDSFRSQQSGSYRSPGKYSSETKTSCSATTQHTVNELQTLADDEHEL